MPHQILMPALSPTMEDGTLARWCIRAGDRFAQGDVIAEIETDKATLEFEAERDGTLLRVLVPEGAAGIAVHTPIAEMAPDAPQRRGSERRIFASPRARSLARAQGVDLGALRGSGPGGRIVARDVEAAETATPAGQDDTPESRPRTTDDRPVTEIPLDQKRRSFIALLAQSTRDVPQFCLRREVLADRLIAARNDFNDNASETGLRLSITDLVLAACARALQQVPEANAIWAGDRILRLQASDLSVAMATDAGLVAPVLRDAETKSLRALSRDLKALTARARAGRLSLSDLKGGSLAVSNLGMHGVEAFEAIVTPPHSAILAVGGICRKPVVDAQDRIVPASTIQLSLSVDHRVTDGALGAALLAAIASGLEQPGTLLT